MRAFLAMVSAFSISFAFCAAGAAAITPAPNRVPVPSLASGAAQSNVSALARDSADSLAGQLSRCGDVLKAMDVEMGILSLDGIHAHLEELYRRYDKMIRLSRAAAPDAGVSPEDIGKVKARTETIHRLFDAGELAVSQAQLRDLIRHVSAFAAAARAAAGIAPKRSGP